MEALFSAIGSIFPFVLVIGVVVTVHELGHYWAGRFFGAAVESFAFGFGEPIFEKKDNRGTRWRVNWIPLGGFVKFVGEMQTPGDSERQAKGPVGKPYSDLKPWQRVVVSLAGPFINFIFAILVFATFAMTFGATIHDRVTVGAVMEDSPAEQAGLLTGDHILQIDGQKIERPGEVQLAVQYSAESPLDFTLLRNGDELTIVIVPERTVLRNDRLDMEEEVGRIGIQFGQPTDIRKLNPIEAVQFGYDQTVALIRTTVKVLHRLVTGKEDFDKMRGPLGIGEFADKIVDSHMKQPDVPIMLRIANSLLALTEMAALFSVSIGFFNLLPIPGLDGYHALTGLYETIIGSEMSVKAQELLLRGGFALIGLFFIAVTWNDIKRTGVLEVFARLLS